MMKRHAQDMAKIQSANFWWKLENLNLKLQARFSISVFKSGKWIPIVGSMSSMDSRRRRKIGIFRQGVKPLKLLVELDLSKLGT